MPNYNQAHFIGHALQGILNQTLLPQEIIVIDDGSTDNSLEVIESVLKKVNTLRLVKKDKNQGVITAINDGMALAKGKYVYFAAADDYAFPSFLREAATFLENNPQAGLCSSLTRVIDAGGNDKGILKTPKVIKTPGYISNVMCEKYLMKYGNWIQSNAALYRRETLNQIGGFPPQLKSYADSFVNLSLALSDGVCFIPEALCAWRRLEDGFSAKNSNDPIAFWQIIENTSELMQLSEKRVFCGKFIKNWKKKMIKQFINNIHETSLEKTEIFENLTNGDSLVKICLNFHKFFYAGVKIISKLAP